MVPEVDPLSTRYFTALGYGRHASGRTQDQTGTGKHRAITDKPASPKRSA